VNWSVAIEEQFYLAFPLLILLLKPRHVPAMLVAVAVVSIGYRLAVYSGPATAFDAYVSTIARLDGLAVGGVLAWAWRIQDVRSRLADKRGLVFAAAGAGFFVLPVLALAISRDLGWHMFHWGHTFLSLWFGAMLLSVLLARGTFGAAPLRARLTRFAGKISYSLYLFHPLVLSAVFMAAGRPELVRGLPDAGYVLCALVLTVTLCWLLSRFVETPAIRSGRLLKY